MTGSSHCSKKVDKEGINVKFLGYAHLRKLIKSWFNYPSPRPLEFHERRVARIWRAMRHKGQFGEGKSLTI